MSRTIEIMKSFLEGVTNLSDEESFKELFKCPISLNFTSNPAFILEEEHIFIFDNKAIQQWIKRSNINPLTKKEVERLVYFHDLLDHRYNLEPTINMIQNKLNDHRRRDIFEELNNLTESQRQEMLIDALEYKDILLSDMLVELGANIEEAKERFQDRRREMQNSEATHNIPNNFTNDQNPDQGVDTLYWGRANYNLEFYQVLDSIIVELIFMNRTEPINFDISEIDFILNTYRSISGDQNLADHNFLINILTRTGAGITNPVTTFSNNAPQDNSGSDITELSEDESLADSALSGALDNEV